MALLTSLIYQGCTDEHVKKHLLCNTRENGHVRSTTEHAIPVEAWSCAACPALNLQHQTFAHVELQTEKVILDFCMYTLGQDVRFTHIFHHEFAKKMN